MAMYQSYEAGKAENGGKVPVYQMSGTIGFKGNYGTNYEPVLELIKWSPREQNFPENAAPLPTEELEPGSDVNQGRNQYSDYVAEHYDHDEPFQLGAKS